MKRIAVVVSIAVILTSGTPAAHASEWGLNGTYLALSDGKWAQTNDIFHDQASVHSTWTISSTCSTPVECTGRVSSDQGWSADASVHGSEWVVKRDIPNWEPCPDGSVRTGHQIFRFYPVDERGWVNWDSTVLAGFDKTVGDSGACGVNKALVIMLPFRLEKSG